MRKILFILLFPSLLFGQGLTRGKTSSSANILIFQSGTLATLKTAAGGSFPFDAVVNFNGVGYSVISVTSLAGISDTANITWGIDHTIALDFPDNATVVPYDTRLSKNGVQIPTTQIVTHPTSGILLSGTTGAINIAAGNGDITLTPTGAITFTLTSAGNRDDILTFIFISNGTSRMITFSTGFKSQGTLSTGTVSGKEFTITFRSDGTTLHEIGRTIAM